MIKTKVVIFSAFAIVASAQYLDVEKVEVVGFDPWGMDGIFLYARNEEPEEYLKEPSQSSCPTPVVTASCCTPTVVPCHPPRIIEMVEPVTTAVVAQPTATATATATTTADITAPVVSEEDQAESHIDEEEYLATSKSTTSTTKNSSSSVNKTSFGAMSIAAAILVACLL